MTLKVSAGHWFCSTPRLLRADDASHLYLHDCVDLAAEVCHSGPPKCASPGVEACHVFERARENSRGSRSRPCVQPGPATPGPYESLPPSRLIVCCKLGMKLRPAQLPARLCASVVPHWSSWKEPIKLCKLLLWTEPRTLSRARFESFEIVTLTTRRGTCTSGRM